MNALNNKLEQNHDQFNLKYAPNPNSYRELLPWHDVRIPNRTLIRAIGFHLVSGNSNFKYVFSETIAV